MNNEINYVSPFKRFCITVGNLPTAYLESMSYYDGLTYLVNYLSNNVIPALNNNGKVVEELQEQFAILKNYVDNYFDNLDVQEEINNKLDEMAASGELTDIIAQYLGLAGMLVFNTVADLKAAENIVSGSSCQTLGYHTINDGGKAKYKVRPITNEDVVDDSTIISLANVSLVAELLIDETITPEQVGCYGNGTNDDTTKFQILLNLQKNIELKDNATYLLTGNIDLPLYTHIEGNKATIKYEYNGTREHQIRNANWLNNSNELNTLYLNNTNFYVNSTNRQIKLIGLTDYNNIVISNCNYSNNLSNSSGSWFLDLYSNCSNILIDNITVDTETTNEQLMNTCIGIREYRSGITSENIKVVNSKFIHNGKDETIWNDSWFGIIKNVIFDNCIVHDKSTSDTTMGWIGSDNSYTSNSYFDSCVINNCIFIKDKLDYAGIKFGYNSNNTNNCFNFSLQNSKFIVKSGSGSILYSSSFNEAIVKNCEFNLNVSSSTYGFITAGSFKNYNNIYNQTSDNSIGAANIGFYQLKEMHNCIVNTNGGSIFDNKIEKLYNSTIKGGYYLIRAQDVSKINTEIINCDIKTDNYLVERINISSDNSILIKDSNINAGAEILHTYNVSSSTRNDTLINCNFMNDNLTLSTTGAEVLTISNCTHKGVMLSGIPGWGIRGACVIGTVFDGGAGHTIVRKISAGNETSNWETL